MNVEKFSGCSRCVNWKWRNARGAVCNRCGSGEFFEEFIRELDFSEPKNVKTMSDEQ